MLKLLLLNRAAITAPSRTTGIRDTANTEKLFFFINRILFLSFLQEKQNKEQSVQAIGFPCRLFGHETMLCYNPAVISHLL